MGEIDICVFWARMPYIQVMFLRQSAKADKSCTGKTLPLQAERAQRYLSCSSESGRERQKSLVVGGGRLGIRALVVGNPV